MFSEKYAEYIDECTEKTTREEQGPVYVGVWRIVDNIEFSPCSA